MTIKSNESDLFQKVLADSLSLESEKAEVEKLMRQNPQMALSLLPVLVEQKHRHKASAEKCCQPPWHPAIFLRFVSGTGDRTLIAAGARRLVTILDPAIDPTALVRGQSVFLNSSQNVLVKIAPDLPRSGIVGIFSRFHGDRVVLKGEADQEWVVEVAAELLEHELKAGDLLLYDRECPIAFEQVEKESGRKYLLAETPDTTFDDIGGLDNMIEEITDEITLHFFHPELAAQHRLKPVKGILLSGPPGVGKTMTAKALANHLSKLRGVKVTFLHVPPGSHRSMKVSCGRAASETNHSEFHGRIARLPARSFANI